MHDLLIWKNLLYKKFHHQIKQGYKLPPCKRPFYSSTPPPKFNQNDLYSLKANSKESPFNAVYYHPPKTTNRLRQNPITDRSWIWLGRPEPRHVRYQPKNWSNWYCQEKRKAFRSEIDIWHTGNKILTAMPVPYIFLYSSAKIIYNTFKVSKGSKALQNPSTFTTLTLQNPDC